MAFEEIAEGKIAYEYAKSYPVEGADGTMWPWLACCSASPVVSPPTSVRACRLLVREGHDVTPLLTPEAETFVSAKTFEALARRETPRRTLSISSRRICSSSRR